MLKKLKFYVFSISVKSLISFFKICTIFERNISNMIYFSLQKFKNCNLKFIKKDSILPLEGEKNLLFYKYPLKTIYKLKIHYPIYFLLQTKKRVPGKTHPAYSFHFNFHLTFYNIHIFL